MAGKPRYTPAQIITAVQQTRGLVSLAAKALGCDPDTIRVAARRWPTVATAIQEERAAMLDVGELALYAAVQQGEAWAVKYLLGTLGKDRGYVEGVEVKHDGDVTVRVIYGDGRD